MIFIAIVNQRTSGNILSAILYSGRQATFTGSRSRNNLDPMSKFFLFLFTCFALFSSLYQAKSIHYSILNSLIIAFITAVIWLLDYLFIWLITQNRKFLSAYFSRGSLIWHILGGVLFSISVIETFLPRVPLSFIFVPIVFFVFFLARAVYGLVFSNEHQFSWYYIILYLCVVYLVPIALVLSTIGLLHVK